MGRTATNKLSIYLIKEEYSSTEDILKDHHQLECSEIKNVGSFYYGSSHTSEPSWIKKFFGLFFDNTITSEGEESGKWKIFSASSKAVFIVPVEKRIFVLSFGYGHTLLNPGVYEENFGLKTAINMINVKKLRKIDRKNMSIVPKLLTEQATKDGTSADFGIDTEQDLLQGITGKVMDKKFGTSVTGKAALALSVKIDISNIKSFLTDCYEIYKSDSYKEKDFGWIDHVAEVKDPKTVHELDAQMVDKIKNNEFTKVWMSIPEIIDWEKVNEFRIRTKSLGDDIDLSSYIESISDTHRSNLSADLLKRHKVDCISASLDMPINSWKVYNCLYCEIEKEDRQIFILSNGKWYRIESDFAKQVFNSFDELKKRPSGINLPACNLKEHEDKYNDRAAKEMKDICNMDGKIIRYGGPNQQIEFCDLYTKVRKIIHVKHYGASSVLSHLFAQGLVSGRLFLFDGEFRKKVNEKLPNDYKLENPSENPIASDYEIIFAIISRYDGELDIPFFSKVNIRNVYKDLSNLGYSVSLLKISTSENEE